MIWKRRKTFLRKLQSRNKTPKYISALFFPLLLVNSIKSFLTLNDLNLTFVYTLPFDFIPINTWRKFDFHTLGCFLFYITEFKLAIWKVFWDPETTSENDFAHFTESLIGETGDGQNELKGGGWGAQIMEKKQQLRKREANTAARDKKK